MIGLLIGYFISNSLLLLIAVAFYTLAERKVIGSIQRRKGPELVGFLGILQPFADGLKAVLKESIVPSRLFSNLYYLSPLWVFFWSLLSWFYIPLSLVFNNIIDFEYSLLMVILFSTIGSFGLVLAGWGSNSKYAFLGSLRSISQLISYELVLSLTLLPIIIVTGTYNLITIVYLQKEVWNFFLFMPLSILFFICILAETNRVPFDLPEAEAELVAGYNLDYSGFLFAIFFLGEYSSMLLMSVLFVVLFFGGWLIPGIFIKSGFNSYYHYFMLKTYESFFFILKILFISSIFIFIRTICPRYRFDQLLKLCWSSILPLTVFLVFFYITTLYTFNMAPIQGYHCLTFQGLFDYSILV